MTPLPVPCAGCGELTPYEVGAAPGVGSRGEHLVTPLGRCFVRTHWKESCKLAARYAKDGRPVVLGEVADQPEPGP